MNNSEHILALIHGSTRTLRKDNKEPYNRGHMRTAPSRLSKKQRYLQIAFNSSLEDARAIIAQLPASDRILIEAGTPLIKRYGMDAIRTLATLYRERLFLGSMSNSSNPGQTPGFFSAVASAIKEAEHRKKNPTMPFAGSPFEPYIVADMKTMDRGASEVEMAVQAGASAVIALGSAPIETLNVFVATCEALGVDAMIDMMNVEYPLTILAQLKKPPRVVILHRGVDEERDNRAKMLPLHQIRQIKGARDLLISVAGGDTPREVQSAVFNDADIVVVWKSVYTSDGDTVGLVNNFLKEIK